MSRKAVHQCQRVDNGNNTVVVMGWRLSLLFCCWTALSLVALLKATQWVPGPRGHLPAPTLQGLSLTLPGTPGGSAHPGKGNVNVSGIFNAMHMRSGSGVLTTHFLDVLSGYAKNYTWQHCVRCKRLKTTPAEE